MKKEREKERKKERKKKGMDEENICILMFGLQSIFFKLLQGSSNCSRFLYFWLELV
jgi:hypothetical protein